MSLIVFVGSLDVGGSCDTLVVGSHTHVLAYDVERNVELFHNEVLVY